MRRTLGKSHWFWLENKISLEAALDVWGCELLGPSEGAAAHSKEGAIKHVDCPGPEPVRQIHLRCQLRTVA